MQKIVLFDWNGTLFNDTSVWYDSVKETFRVFGKEAPSLEDYIKAFEGDYLEVYRARGINVSREELNAIYEAYYENHMWRPELAKNAKNVLRALSDRNIFVGLITAQPRNLVLPLLEKLEIAHYFRFRSFHCLDKKETIKKVLEIENGLPENCFYVGDSPSDIKHAKKAGVKAVAYINGYIPLDLISAAAPDYTINNFSEVLDIIEKSG